MDSVEERKRRWVDFYDRTRSPSHRLLVRLPNGMKRPLPHPDLKQARIDWAWNRYVAQMDRMDWLDDDSVPHLDVYTGTEIFAEAFGCRAHRPDDNMPFALPLIRRAEDVFKLRVPDLDTPCLRMLFEIADELRSRGGSDAVLKMVDIQSPMDIAALIWEKSAFYMALVDTPEAVKELTAKVRQLLTAFLDAWFERYGIDFVAHYPDYYVPRGMTLSEDEIGVVSSEMFDEYFLPELVDLSQRYEGIGMHSCAHARHHWDAFERIPDLMLLNLVQPNDVLQEAYTHFAKVTPQMHSWSGGDDPVGWCQTLPPESRVVVQATAASEEDARRIVAAFRDGGIKDSG